MKKKFMFFSFFIIFIFTAAIYSLTPDDLYESKCTLCHSLRDPNNYTKAQWIKNVNRMSPRAMLTAKEIKIIIKLNTNK